MDLCPVYMKAMSYFSLTPFLINISVCFILSGYRQSWLFTASCLLLLSTILPLLQSFFSFCGTCSSICTKLSSTLLLTAFLIFSWLKCILRVFNFSSLLSSLSKNYNFNLSSSTLSYDTSGSLNIVLAELHLHYFKPFYIIDRITQYSLQQIAVQNSFLHFCYFSIFDYLISMCISASHFLFFLLYYSHHTLYFWTCLI